MIQRYFGKQTHNTFCGVQSCCIILNSIAKEGKYREDKFLSEKKKIGDIVEESVVRKQGMTIDQCRDIISCFDGVSATSTTTDEIDVNKFRDTVKMILNSPTKHVSLRIRSSSEKLFLLSR